MAKIGLTVAGLFAIREVKRFFENAISEAREAQRVSALTAQVIKSTGGAANISAGQVSKLATSISNMTGIDDEAIQGGANLLLTFTNLRNEAGKGNDVFNQATQTITDMSAALGTDLKGSAIQVGKALNDPVKGITALTRVGVSFTQQQKGQIAAMVASGNTLGAQKLILHELNREFGGAAAASSTAGEKMKTAFNNMAEAVGTKLLPYLDRAETALTALIISATVKTGPAFGGFKQKIMPVLAALTTFATLVKGLIEDHLQPFFTVLAGLGGAALSQFSFLIGSTLVSAFVALAGALLSPVALIGAAAGAAIYAYTHFAGFRLAVDNLAASFRTNVIPALQEFGTWVKTTVVPALIQFGGYLQTTVIPALQRFGQWVTTIAVPAVVSLSKEVATNLKPAFDQMVVSFQTKVLPALRQFAGMLRENGPEIKTIVTGLLQLTAAWIKMGSAVLGTVLPPLIRLQAFLASKEIPVIGQAISIILKMGAAWITLGRDVSSAVQVSIAGVTRLVKAFQTGFAKITATVQAFPGRVMAVLSSLAATLYATGLHAASELARGIIEGFRQKLGEIASAASSIAGTIKGFFPGSPVKEGPLTSWNDGSPGKLLMGFLAKGLTEGGTQAVTAAETVAGKIRDALKSKIDQMKADFASLRDSISSAFSIDLFSGGLTDFFKAGRNGKTQLNTLIADIQILRDRHLSQGFIGALLNSGNFDLIDQLANSSWAKDKQADALFGQVQSLQSQVGAVGAAASSNLPQKIDRTNDKLQQLLEQGGRADKGVHLSRQTIRAINRGSSGGNVQAAMAV